MLSGTTVAVTGSSGFVGSHLVNKLHDLKAQVLELDLRTGIDITDWLKLKKTPKFDILFHLAAQTFVPTSYMIPREFYYTNIVGTINALEICKSHEAKMIYTSSYVYGSPQYLPIDEAHPLKTSNPYSQSKIIGEKLCESYHHDFGSRIIILRPFNVYGPNQNRRFLIPSIIHQAKRGRIVLKDPRPERDLVYVNDMVEAYLKASQYEVTTFEFFNIGLGKSYSVKEIVEEIADYFGANLEITFTKERRKNEIMITRADISKAYKFLTWEPKVSLREGIKLCIEEWSEK